MGHNGPELARLDRLGLAGIGEPEPEIFIRRPLTCNCISILTITGTTKPLLFGPIRKRSFLP